MKQIIPSLLVVAAFFYTAILFGQDIAGSKDHALITRYPGSTIDYYEEQKYQKYYIATGPETGYKKLINGKK